MGWSVGSGFYQHPVYNSESSIHSLTFLTVSLSSIVGPCPIFQCQNTKNKLNIKRIHAMKPIRLSNHDSLVFNLKGRPIFLSLDKL